MADVIVIGGAPGSGKETLANMLRDHFPEFRRSEAHERAELWL